jgi:hypothetical protein
LAKYLILLLTILISCKPQQELSDTASIHGLEARWSEQSLPISLSLSSDFSDAEILAIEESISEWNRAHTQDFARVTNIHNAVTTLNPDNLKDSTFGIYKITNWPSSLPQTALAVTQLYGVEKNGKVYINHADILINYDVFHYTTDYSFGYDLATVVVHEMGHFLGLNHHKGSRDDSVMYPTITRFTDKRSPESIDIDNISKLYNIRNPHHMKKDNQDYNIRIRQALMSEHECLDKYRYQPKKSNEHKDSL